MTRLLLLLITSFLLFSSCESITISDASDTMEKESEEKVYRISTKENFYSLHLSPNPNESHMKKGIGQEGIPLLELTTQDGSRYFYNTKYRINLIIRPDGSYSFLSPDGDRHEKLVENFFDLTTFVFSS